ncbi:hypothetical protein OOZ15_14395 [Galbibacter sp. EGI 63066]|uniref:hypothetical protein n=1 Tax=Galbibacter sp. EGI 63066 TaxID=2993559 RepID=UPI002248C841|nr:hypothetical protein [Galbibacter sp. EGI 63066]MCX2681138.1 hypothetical protein [Galbibacter sp. EGI 63066]
MKQLKWLFDFYLDSSVQVALAVYALVRVSLSNFDLPYDEAISYALFFGTIVEYGFIKYSPHAKYYIFVSNKYYRAIQFFSGACFIIAVYYMFQLNKATLIAVGVLVLLAFFYVVPAISSKRNFRSLKGMKIYIVGLTWSISTVLLPALNAEISIGREVYLELLQRFIFIVAIMIPFEIRDLKTDEKWLLTLPQVMGVKNVKFLGAFLVTLFCLLTFFKNDLTLNEKLVEWGVGLVSLLLIGFARKEQSDYYSSFFVESIPLLWWGLLLLFV